MPKFLVMVPSDEGKGVKATRAEVDQLVGAELFLRIHDQLGSGIRLEKDSEDGYFYRGVVLNSVVFGTRKPEVHFAVRLSKPLHHRGKAHTEHPITIVLVTARFSGESMAEVLGGRTLTASFSALEGIPIQRKANGKHLRLDKSLFKTDRFVWIGVGEVSNKRPTVPFEEPPWEMESVAN